MLADCLTGLAALGAGGVLALLGAMLLAGLAGGATHCAGMCGPFVITQAAAGAGRAAAGGALRRLAGAALLPYQLGRVTGYAALGAVAGGGAGALAQLATPRLLALPLGLAAAVMLTQGIAKFPATARWRLPHLTPVFRLPAALQRAVARLIGGEGAARRFALGLLLAFLPCGLLYAALAAAAAAGSALAGGLAMAAFALGTVPALAAVALLGRFFGRRAGPRLATLSGLALALNAGLLAVLAARTALG